MYSYSKTENFILSKECLKIIFNIVENPKINDDYVMKFFSEQANEFAQLFIKNFQKQSDNEVPDDKYYFMKRESLILLEKLLSNPKFEKFSQIFTNNVENLKMIMTLANNKSKKIITLAVDILNMFFIDIEGKDIKIKKILLSNKQNFEIFFAKHSELVEIEEKKNFILYELERLANLLSE